MNEVEPDNDPPPPPRDDGAIVVFLVDDQAMIGEAVRRALASEKDISFHYCGSGITRSCRITVGCSCSAIATARLPAPQ